MEYTTFSIETRMHPEAAVNAESLADCLDAWIRMQTKTGKDNFTATRVYTIETSPVVWDLGYEITAW